MKIFVTGASGWIGSAAVPELLAAGHSVLGLARSDESAARISALGAEPVRGSIDDPDSLRSGAARSDGVVHLAYDHDFSQMERAAGTDRAAISALADGLDGRGGPLLIAAGTLGLPAEGRLATEDDRPDASSHPRVANAEYALGLPGVRPIVARFAPTVHGPGDHGFVAVLVQIARDKGVSAYLGDGANRWPAVQRLDAGALVAKAVSDEGFSGVLHAVAEEGIASRDIASAIGRALDLPVDSVPAEQVMDHFGWLGRFFGADCPVSSDLTRRRLDWHPSHPALLDEIAAGAYATG